MKIRRGCSSMCGGTPTPKLKGRTQTTFLKTNDGSRTWDLKLIESPPKPALGESSITVQWDPIPFGTFRIARQMHDANGICQYNLKSIQCKWRNETISPFLFSKHHHRSEKLIMYGITNYKGITRARGNLKRDAGRLGETASSDLY